jgi:anti-sigma factor RsiW
MVDLHVFEGVSLYKIMAYVDMELEEAERLEMEAIIATNSALLQFVGELRSMTDIVRAAFEGVADLTGE